MATMPNIELPTGDQPKLSPLRKLGWFVAIWAGSVAALAIVSYGLKAIFPL